MRERQPVEKRDARGHPKAPRRPHPADAVLQLQRAAGNAAVTALIQRWPSNQKIKDWQSHLNANEPGIPEELVVDGVFGPKTETATRLYQWRNGEPITGWPPGYSPPVWVETQGGGL